MDIARQSRNQKKTSEALPHGSYDVSFLTYNSEPEEALAKVYREVRISDSRCFKWI
jgi:hypothetical protein